MASAMTFRMVGNWQNQVAIPMTSAINVMMEVFRRDAAKVCKTALWYMTQSAAKLTKLSAKKREVVKNPSFRHILSADQYRNIARNAGEEALKPYFKLTATKLMQGGKWKPIFANKKEPIERIKGRGLAKRSWVWGWGKGNPIAGVSVITSHVTNAGKSAGYVLKNKLDYITKALRAGWEQDVERKATNKIMAQAARKMEKDFKRGMNSIRKVA